MADPFDVVVIGAGPGGYIAAIRCAQLGLATACIDDWTRAGGKPAPGGTCTNVGCIPSKALLQSSENYEHAGHAFAEHGIEVKGLSIDVKRMLARKEKVVAQNNDGILYLFKKNKVAFFHGLGSFAGGNAGNGWDIRVDGAKPAELKAKHVIVATGSRPRALPGIAIDNVRILDNDGALAMTEVPQRLGVVGAGVIGLEMGSVWRRLGAQTTVLEALPAFLGAADESVAKEAKKAFAKQGLAIHTGVAISRVGAGAEVTVEYADAAGKPQKATFDKLIVSIGRVPHTAGLAAAAVGLQLDERGFVAVDDECRTNLPGVWAIGDVVRGPMLAHKAEEEGVAVAERIGGQHGHVDFNTIPWVIYTSPEIAWVGKTEQQLKADGVAYRAGSFPFTANGRARALGDTTGFVKILADAVTDRILGVHIIGPQASELIAEGVVAMEFGAASEDLARICHAHPSLSEAMKEAALAVDRRTLNL
jgi:dihydrolipoamide dehydrogenase